MAKKKAKLARLDELKHERAEILNRYKAHEIPSWECRRINRIDRMMKEQKMWAAKTGEYTAKTALLKKNARIGKEHQEEHQVIFARSVWRCG